MWPISVPVSCIRPAPRKLSDEQLTEAGITPGMVRLSVGLENIDDLLEDLSQALAQA